MRISFLLGRMSVALALASILFPGTAPAFPKCNVSNCDKLSGTHSRSEISSACQKAGGIESGTSATSGGYGCVSQTDSGGWVQCDDKGQCIGPKERIKKGSQPIDELLRPATAPIKR